MLAKFPEIEKLNQDKKEQEREVELKVSQNTDRLTELETSLMHLQSDYDSLNDVVLENAKRLDKLSSLLQKLTSRIEAVTEPVEQRNAEDEKPPHY